MNDRNNNRERISGPQWVIISLILLSMIEPGFRTRARDNATNKKIDAIMQHFDIKESTNGQDD